MTDDISIREAGTFDASALVEFNRAMALETEDKDLALETVTAGVQHLLRSPQLGFYTVAEHNASVVGGLMITYEWSDWRNGLFWWVQSVYVKPEYRQRGIYRRLYRYVKTKAEEKGSACGLRLYVEKENHRAQAVYRALGMEECQYLMYEDEA